MIAIRANASPSSGIGHLARCYRLAVALKKRGFISHFFVDQESPLLTGYLHPFEHTCLYEGNDVFNGEKPDSCRFIKALQGVQIDAIIVDDYRLSRFWEEGVFMDNIPLIVLDDRGTISHLCSMIVDGKWTGQSTGDRYKDSVPETCVRMLGPEYLLLDCPVVDKMDVSGQGASGKTVNLMISLGGGGNLAGAASLIQQILHLAPDDVDLCIKPVVGYYATNKEMILSLGEQDRRVQPVVHARNLNDYLKDTTLYIGAAGGTLYEILSMRLPAVTFALADNQRNEIGYLEDIGHYFHLDYIAEDTYVRMAELVWLMISNLDRIQHLYSLPRKVEFDNLGTNRVARVIDCLARGESPNFCGFHVSPPATADQGVLTDNSGYVFEYVDDRHINRYLDARNLDLNLQNMTETKKVNRLDHYIWWLKSTRVSYLLKKAGQPLLYIWHQPRTIDGVTVLVGGWFVCSGLCGPVDALYALNQQLLLTDREFSGIPWVAVIKKTNRYVQSLNKRLGFELLDQESSLYGVAKACFPHSTSDEFLYYFRK